MNTHVLGKIRWDVEFVDIVQGGPAGRRSRDIGFRVGDLIQHVSRMTPPKFILCCDNSHGFHHITYFGIDLDQRFRVTTDHSYHCSDLILLKRFDVDVT